MKSITETRQAYLLTRKPCKKPNEFVRFLKTASIILLCWIGIILVFLFAY